MAWVAPYHMATVTAAWLESSIARKKSRNCTMSEAMEKVVRATTETTSTKRTSFQGLCANTKGWCAGCCPVVLACLAATISGGLGTRKRYMGKAPTSCTPASTRQAVRQLEYSLIQVAKGHTAVLEKEERKVMPVMAWRAPLPRMRPAVAKAVGRRASIFHRRHWN